MNTSIWVRRRGKVNGPFSYQQVMAAIKSERVALTDEVASSPDGPWTTVQKSIRPKKTTESLPGKSSTQAALDAITESTGPPIEFIPTTTNNDFERSSIVVHQLDFTHFLIEGMSVSEVFDRLAYAVAKDHTIAGSFSKSGIIRGSGKSGFEFVVTIKSDQGGVTFLVDGKTKNGAVNIGVLFDPLSVKGWGVFAAVALVSSIVERAVVCDVSTLMVNLLGSVGALELLTNKGTGSVNVTPEKQRVIAISQRVAAIAGYSVLSFDDALKIVKCDREVVTLIGHDKICILHPHSTLIQTIHNMLKEPEIAQGFFGRWFGWLTFRHYIYKVALERSTNTVTVYSTLNGFPTAITAYEMTSSLSLVLVTSKQRCDWKDKSGPLHDVLSKGESFIRDKIARELQTRMS